MSSPPWGVDSAPRSVVDQVTQSILDSILSCELPPGEEVAILDLSERLGVSHIPVREALRRLESRGFVVFRRGKPPQIAPVDREDFEDLFQLRLIVERDVARRSAKLLTAERIERLEEVFADLEAVVERGSVVGTHRLHTEFHRALLPGASRWDRQVLDQVWAASERYVQVYSSVVEQDAATRRMIVDEHRELVEAARSATPREFERAVVDHVQRSRIALRPAVVAASGQTVGAPTSTRP